MNFISDRVHWLPHTRRNIRRMVFLCPMFLSANCWAQPEFQFQTVKQIRTQSHTSTADPSVFLPSQAIKNVLQCCDCH